ncbi:MAG: hypothetical protein QG628_1081 [Patescibacteria group bacterium]|jgi:protein-S-isoprenylcysteine O-methyltransferase Ste14|nr:hypothetical protein [Patescibacteria group bacterium]
MNDTIKSWFLVAIQAILLGLLVFFTNAPKSTFEVIGTFIQVIGLLILLISFYDLRKSLTALPMPKDNGILQIHGLYRYVRHPMYVGVLTLCLGICLASTSVAKYVLLLGLYLLFSYKARYEERLLLEKYPGYKIYMSRVNRFLPKILHRNDA